LEQAAKLSRREDPAILHSLAAALLRAQRKEEARATQKEAVKLRPEDPELQEQLREIEKSGK
jgi:Flp pilus assembly protein TadD